tara:strand:- start:307 stop:3684 length:3378 start_codon:yes stop_codon:yes gene_type:complete
MAELSTYQKESYNLYIANDIDKDTALKLATGELSADDYKEILKSKQVTTEEQAIDEAGYSVELSDTTKKKVAKKQSAFAESAAMDDYSGESYMFTEYEPSKADVVKAYGINAEVKNELPKEVRAALSLGLHNETLTLRDAKHLYINEYLLEDKKLDPELVELHKDKIKFKYQKLNKNIFDGGKGEYNVLTYRVPEELGGTNKWTTTNAPTLIPTGGDLSAIAGDVYTVGSAVAGAIGGSFITPVVGTSFGSAGATFTAEFTKFAAGRIIYGLGEGVDEDEYWKMAFTQAALLAGIDLVATPAFLLTGAAIKKAVLTAAQDKISSTSIKNVIKSGGKLDEGLLKNLDEAKKILKDHGIPEKVADDYLVASVNKVYPLAELSAPKSISKKVLSEIELARANKTIKTKEVENKIIKLVSGLDNVNITGSQKDDIINNISNEIVKIRNAEIAAAKEVTKAAEGKVFKFKTDNPVVNEIDQLGISFAKINKNLKLVLAEAEQNVKKIAKESNVKFSLDLNIEGTKKVLNNIIKEYSEKLVQKMKKPTPQNKLINNKEYVKKYLANQKVKEFYETLNKFVKREDVVEFTKILKGGVENIENMSYSQVMAWRKLILAAESGEMTGVMANSLKKLKKPFSDAIQRSLPKDSELLKVHNQYDHLLSMYQSSFLRELAGEFGYGTGIRVTRQAGIIGEGTKVIKYFTEGGDALPNAGRLKQILDSKLKPVTVANKNKIYNALFEKYFKQVYKEPGSGKAVQTHKEFVEKYGAVYETILGKEIWAKFASSSKNALKVMDDAVENQLKVTKEISEALPGLSVKVIDNQNPTEIVKHILSKMRGDNVTKLVSNLNKTVEGKAVLQDVRRVFVYDFLDQTKVNGLHNGIKLNTFLDANKEAIEQLFNKKFLEIYRSVAAGLTALQDISFLGINAANKSLTEVANQAGLLVDIWAGPLNHKRLIINRVARLYEMFGLGGDSINVLMDYKMFLEAAKKSALGGNYHMMLDVLSGSKNPAHKSLLRKFTEIIWSPIARTPTEYKGLSKKSAITLEFFKDKGEDIGGDIGRDIGGDNRPMPDDPDVFTVVDEILSTLGRNVKKDVYNNTLFLIKQFTNAITSGESGLEKDYKKETFEKEELMQ